MIDSQHIKVVRLSALCANRVYPPVDATSTLFCYKPIRPQPEGLNQRKILITPLGYEPTTFCLIAQNFNQLRHLVYGSEHSNIQPLISSLQKLQSHSNNDITNHPLVKQGFYQLQTPVRNTVQSSSGLSTTDIQISPE